MTWNLSACLSDHLHDTATAAGLLDRTAGTAVGTCSDSWVVVCVDDMVPLRLLMGPLCETVAAAGPLGSTGGTAASR